MFAFAFVTVFCLNRKVIGPGSAACSAGFAEASLVLQTHSSICAQQQPLRTALVERTGSWAVAVILSSQVASILDLIAPSLVPSRTVAVQLEKVVLLHLGDHVVLLSGHVL